MSEIHTPAVSAGQDSVRADGSREPIRIPQGYLTMLGLGNFGLYFAVLTPVFVSLAFKLVGSAAFVTAGQAAQRASLTLLENTSLTEGGAPLLPLARGSRLYVEGIAPEVAAMYGTVVDDPAEADVIIVRTHAPFETRATVFENYFHAGSLDFSPEVLQHLADLAEHAPVVADVFLDRPAILGPVADRASAVIANYGANDSALLDVLTGVDEPRGALPFDIPASMAAVCNSRPDVPFDTDSPRYRFGHGLRYTSRA